MDKKLLILTIVMSGGCSVAPDLKQTSRDSAPIRVPVNVLAIADAVPKAEKRTRAGNPPKYEVFGKQYKILSDSKGYQKRGVASWYGTKFHGRKTSNGEIYDMYAMTAAHKTLPIPSYVRVTSVKNNRSVVVRINDRGPFHNNRLIDLSYTAAVKLGIQKKGTGLVEVVALDAATPEKANEKYEQLFQEQEGMMVYLQVGAFNNPLNAKQLQEKFINQQIKQSRIQVTKKQGNQMFKVQVGPLYTAQQIDHINEKLFRLGYTNTELIVEKGI